MNHQPPQRQPGRSLKPKDDEQRCKYCLKVLTDGDIVYDRHDCRPALTLIRGGRYGSV